MKIKDIKDKMLKWHDFYDQDIASTDLIEKAKTKKELKNIIKSHIQWIQNQNLDAVNHAESFIEELNLRDIY